MRRSLIPDKRFLTDARLHSWPSAPLCASGQGSGRLEANLLAQFSERLRGDFLLSKSMSFCPAAGTGTAPSRTICRAERSLP